VSYTATTSFTTAFTDIPFRHCRRYICDHVIVTCRVVIKQIDSFFGFDMPIKDNILEVQPFLDNNPIIFEMLLESGELRDTAAICQIDSRRPQ
jgi:hypothetical protein